MVLWDLDGKYKGDMMKKAVLRVGFLLCILLAALDLGLIFGGFIAKTSVGPPLSTKIGGVVRLVEDKGSTFCTGTVISAHAILTAAHCVVLESMFGVMGVRRDIEIRPSSNAKLGVKANVISVRPQMDQAVLTGDFRQFQILPYISDVGTLDSKKTKDSKLTACGYPLGGPLYCTTIYYKDMSLFMWRVKGTLIPGMSGGPVFLSNDTVVATNVAVEGADSIVSPTYNLKDEVPK